MKMSFHNHKGVEDCFPFLGQVPHAFNEQIFVAILLQQRLPAQASNRCEVRVTNWKIHSQIKQLGFPNKIMFS
jgi:hypothetical protein